MTVSQAVKDSLASKDTEALQEYVRAKGDTRKAAMFEICKFQTRDATNTGLLSQTIQAQLDLAKEDRTKFQEKIAGYETQKQEAEQTITECDNGIATKMVELEAAQAKSSKEHMDSAREERDNITKKLINHVNVVLVKSSPKDLVKGLEALVGLLRNVKKANNVDVELFFKDADKFASMLKRFESHHLKIANVRSHLEEMQAVFPKFQIDAVQEPEKDKKGEVITWKQCYNIHPFEPLLRWGIAFAEGAIIDLEKQDIQDEITKLEK